MAILDMSWTQRGGWLKLNSALLHHTWPWQNMQWEGEWGFVPLHEWLNKTIPPFPPTTEITRSTTYEWYTLSFQQTSPPHLDKQQLMGKVPFIHWIAKEIHTPTQTYRHTLTHTHTHTPTQTHRHTHTHTHTHTHLHRHTDTHSPTLNSPIIKKNPSSITDLHTMYTYVPTLPESHYRDHELPKCTPTGAV